LTPIRGSKPELTRDLTLNKNSSVTVLVKWGLISADPRLRLDVTSNETDMITNVAFEGTKSYSHVKLPLPAGEYQLRITNFTDGRIEHISVKVNEGKEIWIFSFLGLHIDRSKLIFSSASILEEQENVKGCQFFRDDKSKGPAEIVVTDNVVTCRNEGISSSPKFTSYLKLIFEHMLQNNL
jgi:hypothetical protein